MKFEIRAAQEDDIPALIRIRNMRGVRHGTLALPYDSVQQRGKSMLAGMQAPENLFLAACAGDEAIGFASLHRAKSPRRAHVASLGISIADDWQGKGAGTALFAALTDLADNWLNLHRLELGVFTDNAPAIALYRKSGFEIEGTERADAFRDGAFADSYLMSRLRPGLAPDISAPPLPAVPAPDAPFILRATEPEDLPGLTALMNQPRVRHGTLRAPFSSEAQNRFLVEPAEGNRSIVAMAGGEICGISVLAPGKNRRAHAGDLMVLAVHDSYAGRGIGKALLRAQLDIADNWLNLRRVTLGVLADNERAIALYKSYGFEVETHHRADVFREGGYADSLGMARLR